MFDTNAIYVLWLREIKRYIRSKARIIGTLIMPLFFLLGLGLGLGSFIKLSGASSYLNFLVPGIVGMSLLFTGATSGFMVIWDRQFGFLKEIMVTPNSRLSISLGRIAGGATTSMVPSLLLILIALFVGFSPVVSLANLLIIIFIPLIGATFISVGLILASFVDDPQAFGVIVNVVTFPLFFLSGAIFPLQGLPSVVQYIAYLNPLTYGVDGLRFALFGRSALSPLIDIIVLVVAAIVMALLSTYALRKTEMG